MSLLFPVPDLPTLPQSAQRLRAERDELQARLDQVALEATMGAALKETQKLKDVADDFERDLYQQKLAEAEARAAEVEALRERITELEEENAGGLGRGRGGQGWAGGRGGRGAVVVAVMVSHRASRGGMWLSHEKVGAARSCRSGPVVYSGCVYVGQRADVVLRASVVHTEGMQDLRMFQGCAWHAQRPVLRRSCCCRPHTDAQRVPPDHAAAAEVAVS